MRQDEIIVKLDKKFYIDKIPVDMPFSVLLPELYSHNNIPLENYFTSSFLKNFHGLCINNNKNNEQISKIYLAVFLSEEVLDKIFKKNEKNFIIFTHHPLDMETTGRGFMPLREKYLKEMAQRNISVYVLHTPLDINKDIATSLSIAKLLKLNNLQLFDKHSVGYAGIIGKLKKKTILEEFIEEIKLLFKIEKINYIKHCNYAFKIAVIAGGGCDPELIKEAIKNKCDTYLTGDYINKIDNEFGREQNKQFKQAFPKLNINMIECSHYATEKIVLVNEIRKYLSDLDIKTEFIEQDNPWK